jgi:hypothetical protein
LWSLLAATKDQLEALRKYNEGKVMEMFAGSYCPAKLHILLIFVINLYVAGRWQMTVYRRYIFLVAKP